MAKATVYNPTTGERKAVDVGDPQAFAGGFKLETTPPVSGQAKTGVAGALLPGGGKTPPPLETPVVDQGDIFNKMMMSSLKLAQGVNTDELLKKKRELERGYLNSAGTLTPESLRTLSPEQQSQMRSDNLGALKPQIDENAYQLQKAQTAINNFTDTWQKMYTLGQDYADKLVAPDSVIQHAKGIIEADPSKLQEIFAQMPNEKSKTALMNALDYTKLKPVNEEEIVNIQDGNGGVYSAKYNKKTGIITPISKETNPNYIPEPNESDGSASEYIKSFGGKITQNFNTPDSDIAGRTIHGGYDIAMNSGTTITSPVSGKVVDTTTNNGKGTGWGNSVVIQDASGNKWRLAHLDSATVNKGDVISSGTVLGYSGNTGLSTGPHLHIEAVDSYGKPIDIGAIKKEGVGMTPDGYDISKFTPKFYSTGYGQKVLNNEQQYQTNFLSQALVKDFIVVQNKASSMQKIIDSGVGGPADLALVFDFMKALDPNSVVRESEYETAAKSGNIFMGAFAKFNGYLKEKGGFLPDNVKNGFVKLVEQKLSTSQNQYEMLRGQYRKNAAEQDLNPDHVAPDLLGSSANNQEKPAIESFIR